MYFFHIIFCSFFQDYEDFAVERERQSKLGIVGDQEKKKNGDEALAATKETGEFLPTSFADDIGSNNSGYYELKICFSLSFSGRQKLWGINLTKKYLKLQKNKKKGLNG
jgi:hypothetical protein